MKYFFMKAKGYQAVGNHESAERFWLNAIMAAEKVAPYRYARLSAVKLVDAPDSRTRFKDDATADELREEIMRRLSELSERPSSWTLGGSRSISKTPICTSAGLRMAPRRRIH